MPPDLRRELGDTDRSKNLNRIMTIINDCTYILRFPTGKEFDLELLPHFSPVIEYFGNYRKKYGINAEGTHTIEFKFGEDGELLDKKIYSGKGWKF